MGILNEKKELTLIEIQKALLKILEKFDKICKKYGFVYSLAYGTLLGAVRHKGFIPWDDDVDVMMPRSQYLGLINVIDEELRDSPYRFLSLHTNNEYFAPLAKISDNRTIIIQDYGHIEKPQYGLNIDIFIVDEVPSNNIKSDKFFRVANLYRNAWRLSCRKINARSRNLFYALINIVISIPFRIIGYRFFLKIYDSYCSKYYLSGSGFFGVVMFGEGESKEKFPKYYFNKISEIQFEGKNYKVIENYHDYLTNMYGDYLKLPPIEAQIPKHKSKVYWKL